MQELRFAMYVCLLAISCTFILGRSAAAATETTLHAFTDGSDGGNPDAGLIADSKGNLYSTTLEGGGYGYGTVYKLTRPASGWTQTVIYNFQGGTGDGAFPYYDLAFDAAGNLYGTTASGGIDWNSPSRGWGTVFELSPSGGKWTEKVIHFFATNYRPLSGLIINKAGDMFGETGGSATGVGGSIFGMKNESTGWKFETLFNFDGTDGGVPLAGLIFDNAGNLYGMTGSGGAVCCGTVFELQRGANNTWTNSVLYSFGGLTDGGFPNAPLVSNASGKLYGTTMAGGDLSCGSDNEGCGVVFELTLSRGIWTETVLHSFTDSPDGNNPQAGMTFDKAGNLFGTTTVGGTDGYGTVFELMPQSGGEWKETILYSFTNGNDGAYPGDALLLGLGNVYSTASGGGEFGWGTVFELPGAGK
jgi:uncharacterized repeat protein (TIGR03803 family)